LNRLCIAALLVAGSLLACAQTLAQPPAAPEPAPLVDAPEQPAAQGASRSFFQILFSGGPLGVAIMLVLIGLSLTAVYLAFDNLLVVRKGEIIPDGLSDDVRRLLAEGKVADAATQCRDRPSFLSTVILHGLAELDSGWSEIEKAMEDSTAEQAARLFRRIEYLSVIGNMAPMVGLLGTVSGMLLAFKEVADTEGNAGAAQLADGIYQALVTTVVGLIIAIPALGAFALLRSRVDQLVAEAAYAALHALSPLKKQRTLSATSLPPAPPVPPPPPATPRVRPPA
jgi:biopolymer transport protein ExbB